MEGLSKAKISSAAALLVALYLIYRFRKLTRWQKQAAKVCPGPPCHPLLGNLREMAAADGFSEQLFVNLHAQYGDIVHLFLGPTMLNISINNPDLIHELYKNARERPHETKLFLWYLGNENLLFQRGPLVKEMRMRYGEMIVQRSQLEKLHVKALQMFRGESEKWLSPAGTAPTPVNIHGALGPMIYDVMGQVMFDAPWLETEEGREVYRLHKKLILEVNRWVLWPVGPIFHPGFIDYLLTIRKWHNVVGSILDRRAKEMRENPEKFVDDRSAIKLILTSKNPDGTPFFTRGRAISTMCGFLNGAYDTTHATAYWIFWQLAKNPETQERLVEEFSRVFGNNPNPSIEDIRNCDYLHAFLQECMRARATVPVNQRVSDNTDINLGGYIIPKGTNVNIPNGVIFNDERWFGKDTDKFKPERFIGDSPEAERARKSWIPFGEHTRMCIGQIFALVELKVMIFSIVSRMHVELENPNDPGEVMIEAGVNQPLVKNNFIFRPRDVGKMREEDNLKWWMAQIDAMEKIKPNAGSVAQVA